MYSTVETVIRHQEHSFRKDWRKGRDLLLEFGTLPIVLFQRKRKRKIRLPPDELFRLSQAVLQPAAEVESLNLGVVAVRAPIRCFVVANRRDGHVVGELYTLTKKSQVQ